MAIIFHYNIVACALKIDSWKHAMIHAKLMLNELNNADRFFWQFLFKEYQPLVVPS